MKVRGGDWTFASLGVAALVLLVSIGSASAADPSETAKTLGKLHHSNQMEIEMGKLAQEKGVSREVKSFGKKLVIDHGAADRKVMALARTQKIDLMAAMPATNDDTMVQLRTAKGPEFDKVFARVMLEDHTKDVNEAAEARDSTKDAQLKSLLVATIPVLEQHRDTAQRLVDTLGNPAPGTAGTMPAIPNQ